MEVQCVPKNQPCPNLKKKLAKTEMADHEKKVAEHGKNQMNNQVWFKIWKNILFGSLILRKIKWIARHQRILFHILIFVQKWIALPMKWQNVFPSGSNFPPQTHKCQNRALSFSPSARAKPVPEKRARSITYLEKNPFFFQKFENISSFYETLVKFSCVSFISSSVHVQGEQISC